ncbi:iron uptake system protein EfeO [Streptomyces sp. NPDC005438]|uniref:iron uptake system protein EfeO n=1 Tax=Streptomyces sp. NPDC005438 TaxID=3156880 RepID=UPI0033A52A78
MPSAVRALTALTATAALITVAGCADKSDGGGDGAIKVTATDTACETSTKKADAGHLELAVENKGSKVTEVYVLYPDDRIVTERENIGAGTKAKITAEIKAGDYEIACKPGMRGNGIRQKLTITGESKTKRDPKLDAAVAAYRSYSRQQAEQTLPKVKKFTDAVRAGDLDEARKTYAPSRIGWERTEPVAESFGDIDPKVDVREDGLEDGQDVEKDWTGWHRLERSLWKDKKITARDKKLATKLDKDLDDWRRRVGTARIDPTSMANGAKELLDEVATGKVTGEEERYSHTDLVDLKANVEGAEKAYSLLKPVARKNDPKLVKQLDARFDALNKELEPLRNGKGSHDFVSYDTVGKKDRKSLSDVVNALAEPLSKLAAAVVGKR